MKKTLVAICILLAFFMTGCVEEVNPEATWTLVSMDDGKRDLEKDDGTLTGVITISLTQQNEKEYGVSGFSGVNHFNGIATVEGNSVFVTPLAVTMMIGAPEEQMVEDAFLKVLQEGGRISIEKDDGETTLSIKNSKNDTELEFVQTLLENTAWNISMYNIGNAVTNVPSSVQGVTLAFSDDGKVYGSTGVNNLMGSYSFNANGALSLSALGTTRMAAPNEEVRDFEMRLLMLLEEVASFEISSNVLTLRSGTGETLLVYNR